LESTFLRKLIYRAKVRFGKHKKRFPKKKRFHWEANRENEARTPQDKAFYRIGKNRVRNLLARTKSGKKTRSKKGEEEKALKTKNCRARNKNEQRARNTYF
jgi:hypothetical protein